MTKTKIFENPLKRDQFGIFSFIRSKVLSKTSETVEKWETSIALKNIHNPHEIDHVRQVIIQLFLSGFTKNW